MEFDIFKRVPDAADRRLPPNFQKMPTGPAVERPGELQGDSTIEHPTRLITNDL